MINKLIPYSLALVFKRESFVEWCNDRLLQNVNLNFPQRAAIMWMNLKMKTPQRITSFTRFLLPQNLLFKCKNGNEYLNCIEGMYIFYWIILRFEYKTSDYKRAFFIIKILSNRSLFNLICSFEAFSRKTESSSSIVRCIKGIN